MLTTISTLFERDLKKLTEEISLYKNETDLWKIKDGISNSGGNLTLHLVGNLNHFIGATLGSTGYIRERDKEFSLKDIPRKQLIDNINTTSAIVTKILSSLSKDDFEKDFPIPIDNKISSTGFILIFLLAHLSYHLGQINYHRRLVA
jgi:hypothetical protein